jgi:hypothetical protein
MWILPWQFEGKEAVLEQHMTPAFCQIASIYTYGFSQSSSVFPCQYHSTVGSTFPKIKKIVLSLIYSPLHSSGDGQEARKIGRSPVRPQSHPYNQNTEYTRMIHHEI